MIRIKYAGNKPIISPNGISFEGKEDKYLYIKPALKLLLKIEGKNIPKNLDDQNMISIIQDYIPNIHNIYKKELKEYEKKLELEKKRVEYIFYLNESEKNIFKKNLDFMKDYRIQRKINKIVYEELINKITDLIIQKNIKELKTSFSKNFFHIIHSIKNRLEYSFLGKIFEIIYITKNQGFTLLKIKSN